jgi:hypothetical protein
LQQTIECIEEDIVAIGLNENDKISYWIIKGKEPTLPDEDITLVRRRGSKAPQIMNPRILSLML